MTTRTAMALALVVTLGAGCASTHRHGFLGLEVAAEEIDLSVRHDLPPSYDMLALRVSPAASPEGAPGRGAIDVYPFPLAQVSALLEEVLAGTGAFRRVVALEENGVGTPADAARAAGADLLLEIRLDDPRLVRVERTDDSIWSALAWVLAGWGTHWWHDQIFELSFRPTARLLDVRAGLPVATEALPEVMTAQALSFHERTDDAAVYFLTLVWPPGYSPVDPTTVAENLLRASRAGIGRALASLVGRLGMDEVARLRVPEKVEAPVHLALHSPPEGGPVRGTTDLALALEASGGPSSIESVALGGEAVWPAQGGGEAPEEEPLFVRRPWVSPPGGTIPVEIRLRGRDRPVLASIEVRREVRLAPPSRPE